MFIPSVLECICTRMHSTYVYERDCNRTDVLLRHRADVKSSEILVNVQAIAAVVKLVPVQGYKALAIQHVFFDLLETVIKLAIVLGSGLVSASGLVLVPTGHATYIVEFP